MTQLFTGFELDQFMSTHRRAFECRAKYGKKEGEDEWWKLSKQLPDPPPIAAVAQIYQTACAAFDAGMDPQLAFPCCRQFDLAGIDLKGVLAPATPTY